MLAVNGVARAVIILPGNSSNEGWMELSAKIEEFIQLLRLH